VRRADDPKEDQGDLKVNGLFTARHLLEHRHCRREQRRAGTELRSLAIRGWERARASCSGRSTPAPRGSLAETWEGDSWEPSGTNMGVLTSTWARPVFARPIADLGLLRRRSGANAGNLDRGARRHDRRAGGSGSRAP
jgi:hypothetical protein